ncbi:MAG: hypothetical protein E7678_07930 [Ruminococcaceae bacterium]|nr:hypothetical protein [Oscillospiraceae bacterium]
MPSIENFATVSYTSGGITSTKVSNIAEISIESAVGFTKTSLGNTYNDNSVLTYILTVTNSSGAAITGSTITDNLGTYLFGATELTPLEYVAPAVLLINGQDVSAQLGIDSSTQGNLIFTIPTIPAGATANIIYKAQINDFAPLAVDSTIVNTSTFESNSECADTSAEATVSVANTANIQIIKQMCPNPVICGDTITYTIRIYNYGNTAAENVILTDDFNPAPGNITVSRDGILLLGTDYTYVDGTLTVPSASGTSVTVPPATFTQDPITGIITITPSVVEYTITGTI